jgi:hypothetical protein
VDAAAAVELLLVLLLLLAAVAAVAADRIFFSCLLPLFGLAALRAAYIFNEQDGEYVSSDFLTNTIIHLQHECLRKE